MEKKQSEEGSKAGTEACFKPKNGSVFPKKKKSVKRMMFDCLVQSTTPNNGNGCLDPNKTS
ncbi:conserved hypothetical protein [Ricinus communis]|uniref:Uncharacterized protein n=1 Tax=Ricinus communis TaxID=3988 RepID=B9S2R5_RICCO|nr:conserved hypothetical protein [Ricinus communis]